LIEIHLISFCVLGFTGTIIYSISILSLQTKIEKISQLQKTMSVPNKGAEGLSCSSIFFLIFPIFLLDEIPVWRDLLFSSLLQKI